MAIRANSGDNTESAENSGSSGISLNEEGRNDDYDRYAINVDIGGRLYGKILLESEANAGMDHDESPLAGAYNDYKSGRDRLARISGKLEGNLREYRELVDNEPPEGYTTLSIETLNNGIMVPTADGGEKALEFDEDEDNDDLWLPVELVEGDDDIPAIFTEKDAGVSDNDDSEEKDAGESPDPRDVCSGVKGDGEECSAKSEKVQETGYCGFHQDQRDDVENEENNASEDGSNISDALREKIMQLPADEREEAFAAMLE